MNELNKTEITITTEENSAVQSTNVAAPMSQEESKSILSSETVGVSNQQLTPTSNEQNPTLKDQQNDPLVKSENEDSSKIDQLVSLPESPILHAGITILPDRDIVLVSIGTHIEGSPIVGPVQIALEALLITINKLRSDYKSLYQHFRLSEIEKRKIKAASKTIQNKDPKVKVKLNAKKGVQTSPPPAEKAVQFSDHQEPVNTPVIQESFSF